jgi:hypothetical protein
MAFRYTIETNTVTTTFSRTVYPSTTTVVTFVECTPRPSISRVPPMGPSPSFALSTGAAQSKRQVAVISTTVHQTRIIYAASTFYLPRTLSFISYETNANSLFL